MTRIGDLVDIGQRPCWKKERHATPGKADAAMRSLLKQGLEKDASRINVYQCEHCGSWHVGHRKQYDDDASQ